jgi:uncharacterized protein (DUF1015 family)
MKKKLILKKIDAKKLVPIDGHHRIAATNKKTIDPWAEYRKMTGTESGKAFMKYLKKAMHPPYMSIVDMLKEAFNKGIEFERKRKK